MTRIKTCGMFRPADIEAVNAARPDYCGFVVDFPRSHRSIDLERLVELRGMLDERIEAVGVFVDADVEAVARAADEARLDLVQLHGHEDDFYMDRLRARCDAQIVKAVVVKSAADIRQARRSSADYVLLDNGTGTGETFDWELIGEMDRPFFLAGGLTPDTIVEAVHRLSPYAVDISSGLETDKVKDPAKIAAAVAAVRKDA